MTLASGLPTELALPICRGPLRAASSVAREIEMGAKRGRAWKMERASVTLKGRSRPRSNKYRPRPADTSRRPAPGRRQKAWVGGYTKANGTKVRGHYRSI